MGSGGRAGALKKFVFVDACGPVRRAPLGYAKSCLEAAGRMGYEGVLAADSDNPNAEGPWKSYRIYENPGMPAPRRAGRLGSLAARASMSSRACSAAARALAGAALERALDRGAIRRFARDTAELLSKAAPGDGDVVFFRHAGLTCLFGVAEAAAGARLRGRWNFRMGGSIYDGPPDMHAGVHPRVWILRAALGRFLKSGVPARFWTDSEGLTREFNTARPGLFSTLPAQAAEPGGARPRPPVLTVSCLGSARMEKGYHLIPGVIESARGRLSGRARFVVQSNAGQRVGPSEARALEEARQELEALPRGLASTVGETDDPEYRRIFDASDIMLMPYERGAYHARESGAVEEALGAGIPVVVPSGTAPARRFLEERYRHQDSLARGARRIRLASGLSLGRRCRHEFEVPVPGRVHALIRVEFAPGSTAGALHASVAHESGGRAVHRSLHVLEKTALPYATCLVRPRGGAGLLRVSLSNPFARGVARAGRVEAALLDSGRPYPWGAVGCAFDDPGDIADCLCNVADHYGHYRSGALAASAAFYEKNNAGAIVRALAGA